MGGGSGHARSQTFTGIAEAMATQWTSYILRMERKVCKLAKIRKAWGLVIVVGFLRFCSFGDSDYIYTGVAGGKPGQVSQSNTNTRHPVAHLITQVYNTSETSKRISKHTRETLGYMY